MAVFVGIFLVLLAPWIYRNYKTFGVAGVSAQPAFNLYVYLVPTVLSLENNTSFGYELQRVIKVDGFDENNINLSNASYYKDKAVEILKQHPRGLIYSVIITGISFFTHDGLLTVLQKAGVAVNPYELKSSLSLLIHSPLQLISFIFKSFFSPIGIIVIGRLAWWIITGLLVVGILYLYRRREIFRIEIVFTSLLIAYFTATTAINGLGVNARFRMPINALILALAAYGGLALAQTLRNRYSAKKQ